jgi:hypothetical protein
MFERMNTDLLNTASIEYTSTVSTVMSTMMGTVVYTGGERMLMIERVGMYDREREEQWRVKAAMKRSVRWNRERQ